MRRWSSYYERHNNKHGRSETQAELGSSEQLKCDLREEIREGPSEKDKCELRFEDVEKKTCANTWSNSTQVQRKHNSGIYL